MVGGALLIHYSPPFPINTSATLPQHICLSGYLVLIRIQFALWCFHSVAANSVWISLRRVLKEDACFYSHVPLLVMLLLSAHWASQIAGLLLDVARARLEQMPCPRG